VSSPGHVRAAAHEAPIDAADTAILGDEAVAATEDPGPRDPAWVRLGVTTTPAAAWRCARRIGPFTIVDSSTGSLLGRIERSRVCSTVHGGAVYLHGESFLVRELQTTPAPWSTVSRDWYTQPKRETETAVLALREARAADLADNEVTDVRRHTSARRSPHRSG
jgi:DEAD/DEAH box helicase domain-containing protein